MDIEFDPEKRLETLAKRKLDMADAAKVFEGSTLSFEDVREDYGEKRFLTFGYLETRMVVLCWTPRETTCRIISMRKTNDRETKTYRGSLGIGTG